MHEDFHKPQAFFDQVHDGIVLPLEICDHLLQTMVAEGLDIDDRVAKAFRYFKVLSTVNILGQQALIKRPFVL